MLPKLSGGELLRRLRRIRSTLPVLVLTARDATDDKVKQFEAGADDYLTKPFDFAELLVRVKALLRRAPVERTDVLRIADLELNRLTQQVHRGGQRIELTAKEYAVLEYLMSSAGRVFSRTMILEHVWDQSFEGVTNIVDVYVRYLRRKIDEPFPSISSIRCAVSATACARPTRSTTRSTNESSLARFPARCLVRAAAERDLRAGRRRYVLRARAVPAFQYARFAAATLGPGRADSATGTGGYPG